MFQILRTFFLLKELNANGKRQIEDKAPNNKKILNTGHARVRTSDGDPVVAEKKNEILEPHTFAPQDLLALLRNLENEICICELSLKDENDKQNKYRVTFFTMKLDFKLMSYFL